MRSPYQNDFWNDPIDGYFAETGICHNERICMEDILKGITMSEERRRRK